MSVSQYLRYINVKQNNVDISGDFYLYLNMLDSLAIFIKTCLNINNNRQ